MNSFASSLGIEVPPADHEWLTALIARQDSGKPSYNGILPLAKLEESLPSCTPFVSRNASQGIALMLSGIMHHGQEAKGCQKLEHTNLLEGHSIMPFMWHLRGRCL